MFVSKLLNKLFFNTNNDCNFTTLTNLSPFMLTKNNHRAILERDGAELPVNNEVSIPDSICNTRNNGDTYSRTPSIDIAHMAISTDDDDDMSINDDSLLERKNKFQHESSSTDNSLLELSKDGGFANLSRCHSPIPFSVSTPETPLNTFRPLEQAVLTETQFSGGYSPKQQDSLFWCIYIIANGYGEYTNIGHNYGVKELEIKEKVGLFVANEQYKNSRTNYKITKVLKQEIHSELLTNQKETSFPCLLVLCSYYKINVVLVHANGKIMLEFISNSDEETPYYILKKDTYGKYSVDTDKKFWKDVQEMKERYVCIDNYMKPMKAANHYKMQDLDILASKLNILDITKKYKKTELYHNVSEVLNWYK
jgi:hypothetical protein